ncbi:MAG: hypothetical protein J4O03_12945 [Chloroflexi bacterium]|nr:hypothetical protein [Chloroflexota bacterium]MCI0781672.1 hypothetical protein [Chloroflexota bacterium]MCI0787572.1 hypothetical protein [Chloroflexota bacterium]MCI0794363.1 hypothetical protein [Chloroflexota bacterium]MCI0799968.1 hypothetical protein [Chloroflexota bacterium]
MYDLARISQSEMAECGNALKGLGSGAGSMEETANKIVRYLYDNMTDAQTGDNACALIRFYKTHSFGQLDAGLQEFAQGILGRAPDSPDMKCLTMLATAGENPAWNSRANSAGHRAIPLASAEFVEQIPMIAQLISQFGIEMGSVLNPDPSVIVDLERRSYNAFYIADAVGSPYIPAQDEFVIPYGVKSVVGFGGVLSSGELFAVIMFSKVSIPRETAESFRGLAASVKEAVQPYVGGAVFA